MRRRDFLSALGGATAVAWSRDAHAQPARKVWRIGFLAGLSRPASFESDPFGGFLQGMRELGYADGKDFIVEWRFAEGRYDQFPILAAELARLNVDVIVVTASTAIRFVQQATSTIPIVMGYSIDPVGNGLVASLARPGGNTTGLGGSQEDIISKHVELIHTAVPRLSRLAILSNPANPNHGKTLSSAESAAAKAGLVLVGEQARNVQELDDAFARMTRQQAEAVVVIPDSLFNNNSKRIGELALRERLPSVFALRDFVAAGGLLSYGENLRDFLRRSAAFVDKIFKGAKPGDLPIQQPTRFFLVVNLRTAKALGISLSESFLLRADELIE
jgi:putative ABC transport system substrate-binding protein